MASMRSATPAMFERRRVLDLAMSSPQELEAAARLTAPLISEGADVDSFVGPPPPPAAVTGAESANDAECHEEVERILAPDIGNAYELLGLRVGATDESLKNRYWKLSLLVHPDKCTHPQAHEAFRALNQAFKDLQGPPKRSIIEQKIEKKETREEFQVDEEAEQHRQWQEEQTMLKRQLVLEDDFSWKVKCNSGEPALRYIGGVDLSFFKKDPKVACGALVVVDLNTMDVIYEDLEIVHLSMPYIPGFLAFRESPVLVGLLRKLASKRADIYPQVLMVDGNGILHPRGFGLASHIGVLVNIPTIGVAKNLYHVDGLSKEDLQMPCNITDATPLIGSSGQVLGMAIRSHQYCIKPIFVSIGHRISLSTAVDVVQKCCKYRIPEPVRQADIRSRKEIRVRFGM